LSFSMQTGLSRQFHTCFAENVIVIFNANLLRIIKILKMSGECLKVD